MLTTYASDSFRIVYVPSKSPPVQQTAEASTLVPVEPESQIQPSCRAVNIEPFEAVYVPFFAIGKEAYRYAHPPVLPHPPQTRFSPALQDAILARELLFTRRMVHDGHTLGAAELLQH